MEAEPSKTDPAKRKSRRFHFRLNDNPQPPPARMLINCVVIWLYTAVFLWVVMNSDASLMWLRVILIALLVWVTFCAVVAIVKWRRHGPNSNDATSS